MAHHLRVEKRREAADLTLTTGATVSGYFFLSGSSPLHTGPERVGDVLNREPGFFPFQYASGETSLVNRVHVLKVTLPVPVIEEHLGAGYDVATRRTVSVLLTNGETVRGHVAVYLPPGRDRLSDYAQIEAPFRYIDLPDRTILINAAHIVALTEDSES